MIGVIADDLTGAAELGAVALRYGLRTEIFLPDWGSGFESRLDEDHSGRTDFNDCDLICISTESRLCASRHAARRARNAARWLRQSRATWIYKKTDSVLRGQVTAEIEAIMLELGCPRTLLLPANPSLGRTIRNGSYFIRGAPLHRTDFSQDPQYPRRTSTVVELVSKPIHSTLGLVKRGQLLPDQGIFIGEVSTSADTRCWVARWESDTLLAGGAETFGAALNRRATTPPKTLAQIRIGNTKPHHLKASELFVCGSTSAACRGFVESSRLRGVPVIGLPSRAFVCDTTAAARRRTAALLKQALAAHSRVILHPDIPTIAEPFRAKEPSKLLGRIAQLTLSSCQVARVYAEGGETAAAILRCLGWTKLSVTGELAPGVAVLHAGAGNPLIIIKPGSYGWPKTVLRSCWMCSTDLSAKVR